MNEALLQQLDANPDDAGAWAVLADWLEERGDARAEWLRWTAGDNFPGSSREDAAKLSLQSALARAEATWFPGRDVGAHEFLWRHGFVSAATLRSKEDEALLTHPALRFVRELNLHDVQRLDFTVFRHLRVLRSSLNEAGRLALPPSLEMLVMLNTWRVQPGGPSFAGHVPKALVVDVEWEKAVPKSARVYRPQFPPRHDVTWHVTPEVGVVTSRVRGYRDVVVPQTCHWPVETCGVCEAPARGIFERTSHLRSGYGDVETSLDVELWCPRCGCFTRYTCTVG